LATKTAPCPKCRTNGKDRRGDNLVLYPDGGSHCFSCGHHGWPKHYVPRVEAEPSYAKALLPYDFTREVPGNAWKWLLQFGLGGKYWEPFIGWSEKDSRLIFPQGDFSIGRYVAPPGSSEDDHKQHRKWYVYGDDKKRPIVFRPTGGESQQVVLVEDLISAHKVGQVAQAIPLFGTSVWDPVVPILRLLGAPIVMWLDKDQENGARKRATRLSVLTGLPVRYVFTRDDPKLQSLDNIKEILN
jgi:hypothetical protein